MEKALVNHFTLLVNKLSELNTYNWGANYKERKLKYAFDTFYKSLQKESNNHLVDLSRMTVETAKEMGLRKWDDNGDLYLFPLWFMPLIPIGTEVTAINGEKIIYDGTNLDNDIRFGCIAYGIELKE